MGCIFKQVEHVAGGEHFRARARFRKFESTVSTYLETRDALGLARVRGFYRDRSSFGERWCSSIHRRLKPFSRYGNDIGVVVASESIVGLFSQTIRV